MVPFGAQVTKRCTSWLVFAAKGLQWKDWLKTDQILAIISGGLNPQDYPLTTALNRPII